MLCDSSENVNRPTVGHLIRRAGTCALQLNRLTYWANVATMALLLLLGIAVGGLIAAAIVSQLRAFLTIRAIPSPPGSWLLGHPGVIDK